jgi:hypothetical protein
MRSTETQELHSRSDTTARWHTITGTPPRVRTGSDGHSGGSPHQRRAPSRSGGQEVPRCGTEGVPGRILTMAPVGNGACGTSRLRGRHAPDCEHTHGDVRATSGSARALSRRSEERARPLWARHRNPLWARHSAQIGRVPNRCLPPHMTSPRLPHMRPCRPKPRRSRSAIRARPSSRTAHRRCDADQTHGRGRPKHRKRILESTGRRLEMSLFDLPHVRHVGSDPLRHKGTPHSGASISLGLQPQSLSPTPFWIGRST